MGKIIDRKPCRYVTEMIEEKIYLYRLYKSGLVRPFNTVEECVGFHFGIQAQMRKLPFVAVALRGREMTEKQVKDVLAQKKSVVRIWGLRNTMHLICTRDWPILCSYFREQPSWFKRKMLRKGTDYHSVYRHAIELVGELKTFTRQDLIDLGIETEFLGPWGDMLIDLSNDGLICNIGSRNGASEFAAREYWCPEAEWRELSYEEAITEIAKRYFTAYGPAKISDFQHWSGCGKAEAGKIINAAHRQHCITALDKDFWISEEDSEAFYHFSGSECNRCFLLAKFDPLLLAYADKHWLVNPIDFPMIWRKSGHVSAVAICNNRATAVWTHQMRGDRLEIELTPFLKTGIAADALEEYTQRLCNFYSARDYAIKIVPLW